MINEVGIATLADISNWKPESNVDKRAKVALSISSQQTSALQNSANALTDKGKGCYYRRFSKAVYS
jgi:hypothetical protein